MLARLRGTTWQDWMATIQVAVGLLLLAIAIGEVPGNEAIGHTNPQAACAGAAGCLAPKR